MKGVRSFADSSVLMVGNDSNDLSVKDRRIGSGKFDQFLETGASPLLVTTRKN
jgi:hypothetical protein